MIGRVEDLWWVVPHDGEYHKMYADSTRTTEVMERSLVADVFGTDVLALMDRGLVSSATVAWSPSDGRGRVCHRFTVTDDEFTELRQSMRHRGHLVRMTKWDSNPGGSVCFEEHPRAYGIANSCEECCSFNLIRR